jgi:FtsP/CotA-like multicopper oxidase with cupredoxin domain
MRILLAFALVLTAACGDNGTNESPTPLPRPELYGPALAIDENPDPSIVEVTLTASETTVSMIDGSNQTVWAYNGQVPGPSIEANVGDRVIVHFVNQLAEPSTIHWHGLRIADDMDGSPRVQEPVPADGEFTYDFVVPDAGSFWYHPHVRSNVQIERGLYGALVVHDECTTPSAT